MNNEIRNPDHDFSKLSEPFKALIGSPEMMFQVLEIMSQPIEVFDPDGTAIFLNRSCLNMFNIKDASLQVGKYNVLHDPASDEVWGHESIERAFRGEVVEVSDKPVPIQSVVDRGVADEKPFEAAYMDVSLFPIFNGDKLAYVINTFSTKQIYQGLPEVARAKAYIDSHWLDKFDAEAVAEAVNSSYPTLAPLFKHQTGVTMNDYYNNVKIEHLKEKLADKRLNVQQAFDACGVDSRSWSAKLFHKKTGMTPREYKNSLK